MIFSKLPYRLQVPLGLTLAVLITAALVALVSAQVGVHTAKTATLATVNRAVVLLVAQAKPLVAADDTWRIYALLRDTVALLPGVDAGHARLAVLDSQQRVLASSHPERFETGHQLPLLAQENQEAGLASAVGGLPLLARHSALTWVEPIRSDDGQVLGYLRVDIEGKAFEPVWLTVATPALLGGALAVLILLPAGWLTGRRMALPVAQVADCISRISRNDGPIVCAELPLSESPEIRRIGAAIRQLVAETDQRRLAEGRALSAERMAAVGRLTAAVAHEINNPLAGLLTATNTMRLHADNVAQRSRALDLIERGLQQIQATVAALLPQARASHRALTCQDLDDVVALAQGSARSTGVDLQASCACPVATGLPATPLRQVMLNMLLNAAKAAGNGGWVRARLNTNAGGLVFDVANSGVVLTADRMNELMTGESGLDPRGFGLWVCRQTAVQFGGEFQLLPNASSPEEDEPILPGPPATHLRFCLPNPSFYEKTPAD